MRILPTPLIILFLTVVSGSLAVVDRRLQEENQQLRAVNAVLHAQVNTLMAERQRNAQAQPDSDTIRRGIGQEFQGIDASRVHRTVDW